MAQTELAYYYTAIAQRATLSHYSLDTAPVKLMWRACSAQWGRPAAMQRR